MRQRGWRGRVLGLGLVVLAGALVACHDKERTRSVHATAVVSPDTLDFGEVPVGEWREAEVRVRNVGYVPFFALEALALEGNPSFQVELVDGGGRVLPGEDKRVVVRFHPLAEGPLRERLRVETDANTGSEHFLEVLGQGVPTRISLSPPRLDFETLEVDSERTLSVTITNPVDLPLTLVVSGPDTSPFTPDTLTIPPFATREVRTRYLPRGLGAMAARLEVKSCEACSPSVVELSGNSVESAFVFEPAPVAFDDIPVHERTESGTRARNVTWRPVTITRLLTSDEAFIPLSTPDGQTVAPGETVELRLQFAARYSGPNTGQLTVQYESDKPRQSKVVLDARGGRPTLAVAPVALDFGELPVGGKVERVIRLTNAGSNGDLRLVGVRADGAASHFSVDVPTRNGQPLAWSGGAWPALRADVPIAPGADSLELRVFFEPRSEGSWQATLYVASDDMFNPERAIVLTGRARASGPCVYELLPQPVLDFGNVRPGQGAVLGFYFRNPAGSECAVKDIHLSQDAGGAFFMPGGALTGGVVEYDTSFSAMIAFRPPAPGTYSGELRMTVNNPSYPTVTLPIRGMSGESCLVASPPYVDFGPIRYDCAPIPRRTLISNRCAHPVTIHEAEIGNGTSDQFSLTTPLVTPRTLAPGEGFELELTYARNVHGQHYSPLFLRADSDPGPLLIPLLAETNHEGIQVDRFTQGTDSQLDVLFVVSNTTTMEPYQQRLRAAIPGWLERARERGVDVRVGVTSTGLVPRGPACGGGAEGGEAGRLFPVDGSRPRAVSGMAGNAASLIQQNLAVGLCHNLSQGLETMRQALSSPLVDSMDDPRTPAPDDGNLGFVRAPARMAVVVLSDEDDHSGFAPESYIQFLQTLKGTGMSLRSQLYALVPTDGRCTTAGSSGARYAAVAQGTGGAVDSVCLSDYGPFLERLLARAGDPQADFALTAEPTGTEEMSVTVNGVEVDPSRWTYDADRNAVVFHSGAVPRPGELVGVRYRSICRAPPPEP